MLPFPVRQCSVSSSLCLEHQSKSLLVHPFFTSSHIITEERMNLTLLTFTFVILTLVKSTVGGPLAYGICQAGCSPMVVACYGAAGVVFGTLTAGGEL